MVGEQSARTSEWYTASATVVAEALQGTCVSLEAALEVCGLPEGLDESPEFCGELDSRVFCCDGCGWWCEVGEMVQEQLCGDCATDGEEHY